MISARPLAMSGWRSEPKCHWWGASLPHSPITSTTLRVKTHMYEKEEREKKEGAVFITHDWISGFFPNHVKEHSCWGNLNYKSETVNQSCLRQRINSRRNSIKTMINSL